MTSQKLFRKYLFAYISIVLVPLVILFFVYQTTISLLEENLTQTYQQNLLSSVSTSDSLFQELELVSSLIATNQDVLSFTSNLSPYEDLPTILETQTIQQSAFDDTTSFSFSEQIFIYFPTSNVTISPASVYLDFDLAIKTFFTASTFDTETLQAMLDSNVYYNEYFYVEKLTPADSSTAQGLVFIRTINPFGDNVAQLVIYTALPTYDFVYANTNEYISTSVTRADETPFYTSSTSIDDVSISLSQTSDYNNWLYTVHISNAFITENIVTTQALLLLFLILAIIVPVILSIALAASNAKRFSAILHAVDLLNDSAAPHGNNIYQHITSSIAETYQKQAQLQQKLQKELPNIKNALIEKIIHGTFRSQAEIEQVIPQFGFEHATGNHFVLIMKLLDTANDTLNEKSITKHVMAKEVSELYLNKLTANQNYYYDPAIERRLYIISYQDDFEKIKSSLNQLLEELSTQINEEFGLTVLFACGSNVNRLEDIHISTMQAERMGYLLHAQSKTSVLWFNKQAFHSFYYYPSTTDGNFIKLIKTGDIASLDGIFEDIYQQNFVLNTTTPYSWPMLNLSLKTSMLKIINQTVTEHKDPYINRLFTIQENARPQKVLQAYQEICHLIIENETKGTLNVENEVIRNILNYLQLNYDKPEINLNMIAYEFNLNPSYLSRSFKNETGENLSTYLETLRLERACALLKEGFSVADVSEKVGYSSVYVFRTAFKRKFGTPPSKL